MGTQQHPPEMVRSEEVLDIERRSRESGRVVVRKHVDVQPVEELVPIGAEHADLVRVGPDEDDSGEVETLPDGTLSIPVLEEQLVIEKRLVVRERILVRKRTEVTDQRVTAELRTERVEIEDAALD
jgi:stress response protein YsnF